MQGTAAEWHVAKSALLLQLQHGRDRPATGSTSLVDGTRLHAPSDPARLPRTHDRLGRHFGSPASCAISQPPLSSRVQEFKSV